MKKRNWSTLPALAALLLTGYNAQALPLPDTGQTKCYNATIEIVCPDLGQAFYGQDGNYATQQHSFTKLDASGAAVPEDAASWTMVQDNTLGVFWETKTLNDDVENLADAHDADNTYTWAEAQVMIASLNTANYGGHSDWRLPTVKELAFLADRSRIKQGINRTYFPEMGDTWWSETWSSTLFASSPADTAFLYAFGFGFLQDSSKTVKHAVRAVSGAQDQSGLHFQDNNDGTVCDTATELMWQRNTDSTKLTWQNALQYCEDSTLAGYTDWKLPDIHELLSLVDYSQHDPAISFYDFTTYSNKYFSSTTNANPGALWSAWAVDFRSGGSYYEAKTQSDYVRCVRVGGCVQNTTTTTSVEPTTTTTVAPTTTTTTAAAVDTDNDGIADGDDNCQNTYNPLQRDADSDEAGDVCDASPGCGGCGGAACESYTDTDQDGIADVVDNCPNTCNAQQRDTDNDGAGDVCDGSPGCGGCGQAACEPVCMP